MYYVKYVNQPKRVLDFEEEKEYIAINWFCGGISSITIESYKTKKEAMKRFKELTNDLFVSRVTTNADKQQRLVTP